MNSQKTCVNGILFPWNSREYFGYIESLSWVHELHSFTTQWSAFLCLWPYIKGSDFCDFPSSSSPPFNLPTQRLIFKQTRSLSIHIRNVSRTFSHSSYHTFNSEYEHLLKTNTATNPSRQTHLHLYIILNPRDFQP
jgi:hypothetical protein